MPFYPNLHYRDYVDWSYRGPAVTGRGAFLRKAIHTFLSIFWQSVRDAATGIIFLLVLVLLITKMSQGRDIVVTFFEPHSSFRPIRMVITTLAILLYSVALWIIPAFLFEYRDRLNAATIPPVPGAFHKHLFFAHRLIDKSYAAFALYRGGIGPPFRSQ
jgi:hypothetical protein